jgi:proteasome accessory factor B
MTVLHARLQNAAYPNCRKLAAELEVSTKTIQRDIDFMRDQLGLPIQYDRAHLGFFYAEPVTSFPAMEVTSGELVALFVAQKALRQFQGSPYANQLAAAFRKLTDHLHDKISFSWSEVDDAISFHQLGTTEADLQTFEEISRAVLQSRQLEFEYRKLEGTRYEPRRLEPYHLGCIENQWYVIGFDLAREQLRTFALTRIQRARMTQTRFDRPADFSIEKHLGESFGVFAGGTNRYAIRIHFDPVSGQLVSERHWHDSQKLTRLPSGEVELTLELCSLREIERWILSWGPRARVLAPPELIERLRKTTAALARQYEG